MSSWVRARAQRGVGTGRSETHLVVQLPERRRAVLAGGLNRNLWEPWGSMGGPWVLGFLSGLGSTPRGICGGGSSRGVDVRARSLRSAQKGLARLVGEVT